MDMFVWQCLADSPLDSDYFKRSQKSPNFVNKSQIFTLIACCHSELAELREGVPLALGDNQFFT